MSQHLTQDDAAKWASGLMEPDEALALEQHVSGCQPCERLVQREAAVNEIFAQALRGVPVASVTSLSSRRHRTYALVAAAGLALAALVVALVRVEPPPGVSPVQEGIAFIVIDAGGDYDEFMRVPRYEEGQALPAIAQTAFEPFPL